MADQIAGQKVPDNAIPTGTPATGAAPGSGTPAGTPPAGSAPVKASAADPLSRFYGFYIARPRLGVALGRLIWHSDFRPMYASLRSLGWIDAECVLDVACGAGLALGYLAPGRTGRYLGVDSSPGMLAKAASIARRRGFAGAGFERADATAVPLPDGASDLCLLYNCLHCFGDPAAAVGEAARCLGAGGRLLGSMLVRGAGPRTDAMMRREAARKNPALGPGGTPDDLRRWLLDAGFTEVQVSAPDTMAVFTAVRQ
jgi:SAM-dependent methyltransferase